WSFAGCFLTLAIFIMAGNALVNEDAPRSMRVVVEGIWLFICIADVLFWLCLCIERGEHLTSRKERYAFRMESESLAKKLAEANAELFALKYPDDALSDDDDDDDDEWDDDERDDDLEEDGLDEAVLDHSVSQSPPVEPVAPQLSSDESVPLADRLREFADKERDARLLRAKQRENTP
ncbi:MAG: hypothetical protein WC718_13460, partial [Phycisphaerales bacterium]